MAVNDTLMALQRFIARRGVPEALYSDNGTGLMGTKRNLTEFEALFKQKWGNTSVDQYLLQLGVHWHTIPPAGPHMGESGSLLSNQRKDCLKGNLPMRRSPSLCCTQPCAK